MLLACFTNDVVSLNILVTNVYNGFNSTDEI